MSSDFTPEGFQPFSNTQADMKRLETVTEWSDELLEEKVHEYWMFLDRTDLMPRAIKAAKRILEHLGFEVDERYRESDEHGTL